MDYGMGGLFDPLRDTGRFPKLRGFPGNSGTIVWPTDCPVAVRIGRWMGFSGLQARVGSRSRHFSLQPSTIGGLRGTRGLLTRKCSAIVCTSRTAAFVGIPDDRGEWWRRVRV